jgi:threonine/homoserine/homoserine lactone efflux protein
MHCSDELHNQLNSHALIFYYTLIPSFTSCGTTYRPLASLLPQLSILLLLDYGWYSCLG